MKNWRKQIKRHPTKANRKKKLIAEWISRLMKAGNWRGLRHSWIKK